MIECISHFPFSIFNSNELVAVGAPMSAIPDVSRFWTAPTTNDTFLLTWENFAVGRLPAPATRDASGTVSAQTDEDGFGPHQDLSFIVHSNNYYWVDLVVSNANALVTFESELPSDLPAPQSRGVTAAA